ATVLVAVLGVLAGLVFAIIPVISEQISNLIAAVPTLIQAFTDGTVYTNIQNALPWIQVSEIVDGIKAWVAALDFTTIGGGVLSVGLGIASGVTGAVVVLILMIYFIASLTNLKRGLYKLVPASRRPKFIDLAEQISTAVGRYVIGQVSLALVNGILSFIVLTAVLPLFGLNIRYSALLAFIAFLGSLIPLVGTVSGATVITLLVALFNGFPAVLVVAIYYLVYMQVEAYVLNPRIMAKAVRVPGAIVVIAALAGGTLLGILGALIAIPVAAAILLVVDQVFVPHQEEL
ncbi:MAG: AI-2E family transporter, partial [Rhodoglobus sp.]|nr:AI-2E family transporter [Rhodoglobus sp.]